MDAKVWLTTFAVIALLAIGGSGFYAFSSYGKYGEAMGGWDNKVNSIESLEKQVPYPNEKNAEAIAEKVGSYKTSVKDLSTTLQSFNRPLDTELPNTQFQLRLRDKVEKFRAAAAEGKLEIESATDFQLGFEAYAQSVPAPELVPVLDYELEAIDNLLRKLITHGAVSMSGFERDPIPGEPGGAETQDSGVVHKYPVRFRFRGTHEAFQRFINDLANDKDFFYILRVLKVKNEVLEGPLKQTGSVGGFVKYENPTTKEVASPEMLSEWGQGTASEAEVAAKAKEAGFLLAQEDARVLMGLEKLDAFVVVDITRFLGPDEVKQEEPKPEAKKGRR